MEDCDIMLCGSYGTMDDHLGTTLVEARDIDEDAAWRSDILAEVRCAVL